ncbi:glyoxalase [Flavobacterium aquatile]|uniref:Glyoxalase n=1 Tax=Flavobacterium aquatile LMG 4008 = ATCC 11947 TaxID=1453498 RepID=A0A095TYA2_9FLAO|nr:glyoxalase [Flavobacterium aquatile]KGD67358.1 glyoxalase [Flavobacterium aquatile LMG 4008 = ATCC 11947]OXA66900.1 glyoxalase [Flavobacterium aquatile] [Flavobacterium aquatile LMG 4008 = ATCC 11947]GEC78859.1 glyoxalase [Flavobacterium aquatile]
MQHKAKSIRPFIGSENFETSRNFYTDLGFQEVVLAHNMSLFQNDTIGFYLQDAFVKDWIDNTMVFMEVEDVAEFWNNLVGLNLTAKYPSAKLLPIKSYDWGKECFLIDPSGILWHFGTFSTK